MSAKRSTKPRWKQLAGRAVIAGAVGALLWFAVEGGEYGTTDLFAQHAKRAQLAADVAQLRADVDSLEKEKTAIQKNDAVLERIAREQYGMLRGNKEVLFWMNNARATKDSAVVSGDSAAGHL